MSKKIKVHQIATERCKACGLCVAACPKHTLELGANLNAQSYTYVQQVRPDDCIKCNVCRIVCPDVAIGVIEVNP